MALAPPRKGCSLDIFSRTKPRCAASGNLAKGVSQPVEDPAISPDVDRKIRVADLITGVWGERIGAALLRPLGVQRGREKGLGAGVGKCRGCCGCTSRCRGAKVVGIIDRVGGLIREEGMSHEEIKGLFLAKEGNSLKAEGLQTFDEVNAAIWDVPADVFLPCAASRLVTQEQVERMTAAGVEVISSGANVPFADDEIFMGRLLNMPMNA